MIKSCPHCNKEIETCSCGEWGCSFHEHLGNDCPSINGIRYREKLKISLAKREKSSKLKPTGEN